MTGTRRERIRAAVWEWWVGKYAFYLEDPDSGIVDICAELQRHWTSRLAHTILGFLGREWKWLAGFMVTVAGLCIAYAKLV